MRIEHLALSNLTCRIGGCLVQTERRTTVPQEETLLKVFIPLAPQNKLIWQLRCPTKHEKPLTAAR
jgi:hypothetical protein